MGEHMIKLPDVGEGVAEAELVEWMVEIGAAVREDDVLAAVMTDKATVEIPSPVDGKVIWRGGEIGDVMAVGSPLIRLEVEGAGNIKPGAASPADAGRPESDAVKPAEAEIGRAEKSARRADGNGADRDRPDSKDADRKNISGKEPPFEAAGGAPNGAGRAPAAPVRAPVRTYARTADTAPRAEGEKPLASPAVRRRAGEAGIDLRRVRGSGPAGRITHEDLDAFFAEGAGPSRGAGLARNLTVTEVPVIGLRRKIAEKMAVAKSRIPHITYVDEIDMTAIEDLRKELNETRKEGRPKLTILPFLMRAMVRAIADQPHLNALYDDEAGVVRQYGGCHIGVAAQTPNGLMVPVARHVEARDLWDCAEEVARLSDAARAGKASREELTGSTITITSLGALGGVVTTPVINHPEVAIIGVNKMQVKPVWDGGEFRPRKVMNLSSSFDHRVVDGWDAAVFIQRIKALMENPATIFIED